MQAYKHGGTSHDPKCGWSQLRTVGLKYIWGLGLHLQHLSRVIYRVGFCIFNKWSCLKLYL